jgi:CheY-like chemotaxis protein
MRKIVIHSPRSEFRALLRGLLTNIEAYFVPAASREELFRICQTTKCDLVLTDDVRMFMNGSDAVSRIRQGGMLPQIFVLSSGGSGIPVYRRLQREGIPFATGVLNENDTDAAAARALANELFLRPAFEPVRAEDTADACGALLRCERVICTLRSFGPQNEGNRELIRAAEEAGLEIER